MKQFILCIIMSFCTLFSSVSTFGNNQRYAIKFEPFTYYIFEETSGQIIFAGKYNKGID